MPAQPTPNPNNKPTHRVYNNEATRYPPYPVNSIEIDGVQLQSRKAIQEPTITEMNDSPKELEVEQVKEPPYPTSCKLNKYKRKFQNLHLLL